MAPTHWFTSLVDLQVLDSVLDPGGPHGWQEAKRLGSHQRLPGLRWPWSQAPKTGLEPSLCGAACGCVSHLPSTCLSLNFWSALVCEKAGQSSW